MKSLVIYDSVFGNTEKIANAIGEALESQALSVNKVTPGDIQGVEFIDRRLTNQRIQTNKSDQRIYQALTCERITRCTGCRFRHPDQDHGCELSLSHLYGQYLRLCCAAYCQWPQGKRW